MRRVNRFVSSQARQVAALVLARTTDRASELALSEDVELDPTYTAKAFAQMLRHAEGERRGQRLLFIHTLSSTDLGPFTERAPALARWTDRYRRGS